MLVLGAGLGGMTAAYELRKAGYNVTILEYNERPGGVASPFTVAILSLIFPVKPNIATSLLATTSTQARGVCPTITMVYCTTARSLA